MSLFESETLNSPEIQNANTQTYSNILKLSEIDPRALAFFRRSKFSLGSAEMATALGHVALLSQMALRLCHSSARASQEDQPLHRVAQLVEPACRHPMLTFDDPTLTLHLEHVKRNRIWAFKRPQSAIALRNAM